MAISSFDPGLIGAQKQYLSLAKLAARATVATGWFSLFDLAGNPGAGTLAGTSTTAGVVPTDATAGFPTVDAFAGGATGYLAQVEYGSSVACRMRMIDVLFKAGAYGFAAGTTSLAAQPSYVSRLPGGSYGDTQIYIEVSTAFVTGTAWQVQVTYTNQSAVAGRSTVILPATTAANLTLGRRYQLALQTGDTGVQKIDSVVVTNGGTAMTAGAFNVLVVRPLWGARVKSLNDGDVHGPDKTLLPVLFPDSALDLMVATDLTSSGVPELEFVIASG
jgi:hypothetical protein